MTYTIFSLATAACSFLIYYMAFLTTSSEVAVLYIKTVALDPPPMMSASPVGRVTAAA